MEKINNIFMILVSILLVASSLLVTSYSYYEYVQIAGVALIILYMIIRLIQKRPIKLIKNKLDIFVILLVLSTIIPVITNQYVSLYGSLQVILQYVFVLSIYFFIREISSNNKGLGKFISNSLIISAIFLIVLGIDRLTLNISESFMDILKIPDDMNGDNRLISVFGYVNAFAVYIASILFLNINQYLKNENKFLKIIYKTITTIFLIGIVLTYSKGIFLVLGVTLLLYIYKLKDKNVRLEVIQNLIVSGIFALIYVTIFEQLFNAEEYVWIFIVLGIVLLINVIINFLIQRFSLNISKINFKKLIIILGVFVLIFIIYVLVGLQIYDEYVVFSESEKASYDAKIINNVLGGTKYVFEFDVDASVENNSKYGYKINLKERDAKNLEICNTGIEFKNYNGTKKIEIVTNENTREIKIEFETDYRNTEKSLIVKSLKINEKEVPLEYKYLPTKLVEKVANISIQYKTAQERFEMIENAMELSKDNWLTGIGGDGWQYKYKEVQSYDYSAKNLHSYPAKVLLEFGVLGVIAFLGILIVVFRFFIKNKDLEMISIMLALLTLILHSFIDANMETTHVLMFLFVLLGVISKSMESDFRLKVMPTLMQKSWTVWGNVIFILGFLMSVYMMFNMSEFDYNKKVTDMVRAHNSLKGATEQEYSDSNYKIAQAYEELLEKERYNFLSGYFGAMKHYINSYNKDVSFELNKHYEKLANYENKEKNNEEVITLKLRGMYDNLMLSESRNNSRYYEINEKFIDLILSEVEGTKQELRECLEKQYIDVEIYPEFKFLDMIYERTSLLKKNYLLGTKIYNLTDVEFSVEELENIAVDLNKNVLVYHTHGTESYKSEVSYERYEPTKSTDNDYNVTRVGRYLTELLEGKGYSVIHESGYYDLPVVSGAYDRARVKLKDLVAENEEVDLLIDVHRDSLSEFEHEASTVEINGEKVAQLRFVLGIDQDYENWMRDLKFALDIQKKANKLYPGLFKSIIIRDVDYNQDLGKCALLIEVGEEYNYLDEALNSVKYFAELV